MVHQHQSVTRGEQVQSATHLYVDNEVVGYLGQLPSAVGLDEPGPVLARESRRQVAAPLQQQLGGEVVEDRAREWVAGVLEAEQVPRDSRTLSALLQADEVGVGLEGAGGEDDVGGEEEGAPVPPREGPAWMREGSYHGSNLQSSHSANFVTPSITFLD